MCGVERCLFVKQVGGLYAIQDGYKRYLIPVTKEGILTSVLANQRQIFINDVSKDILITDEIRSACNQ